MGDIAKRLRQLREKTHPTPKMTIASQMMGLHPDLLRRYERGEVKPSLEALIKIADYYGVSTDYLLCRTEVPYVAKK